MADDLDSPTALRRVQSWVEASLAIPPGAGDPDAPALMRDLLDAALGLDLTSGPR
mgnify:CR=1 FL=1